MINREILPSDALRVKGDRPCRPCWTAFGAAALEHIPQIPGFWDKHVSPYRRKCSSQPIRSFHWRREAGRSPLLPLSVAELLCYSGSTGGVADA